MCRDTCLERLFPRLARSLVVPKGPDPRKDTASLADVPRLLREGAAEFNARRFWHAHEAWESAWHALRAHRPEAAGYVRGMILVAAALENATRRKESGFKRQFAEGLHALKGEAAGRAIVALRDAHAWEDALAALYADACRHHDFSGWNEGGWQAPDVEFA